MMILTAILSEVTILTPDTIKTLTKPTVIKFFAPWCGHCQKFAPIFVEIQKKAKNCDFAEIDCTKYGSVCDSYGVHGYPTIMFIHNNKTKEYKGNREVPALLEWSEEQAKEALNIKETDSKEVPKKTDDKVPEAPKNVTNGTTDQKNTTDSNKPDDKKKDDKKPDDKKKDDKKTDDKKKEPAKKKDDKPQKKKDDKKKPDEKKEPKKADKKNAKKDDKPINKTVPGNQTTTNTTSNTTSTNKTDTDKPGTNKTTTNSTTPKKTEPKQSSFLWKTLKLMVLMVLIWIVVAIIYVVIHKKKQEQEKPQPIEAAEKMA